jgi:2-methylisocitrate lyase-like PEP mutase family enzyme
VEEIRAVCGAVSRPVNVLAVGELTGDDIAAAGARRISLGGRLTWAAAEAATAAATAIRDRGDFSLLTAGPPGWLR